MRIPLRVKFFVVLLAFSLGPILLTRGVMDKAANKLAEDLSDNTRKELLTIVSAELQHNAKSLLKMLEVHGQAMTLSTYVLGQQTLNGLHSPLPKTHIEPYFALDFADPDTTPPDAAISKEYTRKTMSGRTRPLTVSFEHPAIHLPQTVDPAAVADEIQHLHTLLPTFKKIHDELNDASYTMEVALESGVMLTYPGRSGFPMMYDARDQEWYKRTKASGSHTWTTPSVDPTSRQAVATGGYPILDKNGTFIGVASISVPLSAMLYGADLKSRWSDEIQSFMVIRFPGDIIENDGLLIVAQESYDEGGRRHWMSGIETEWLASDDPKKFKELVVTMANTKSGFMRMSYNGKDSVWAYATNPDFSFLLIAPETVIAQLPDQVAGSLYALFDEMRDISGILSGVMLIITGIIAWFGSSRVTKPMLDMADSAKRLAKGDFSVRMTSKTGDERDILRDSFNEMVPKLQERMHLRRDLELAQEVQNLLLPRTTPSLAGYDISGGIS